MSTNLRFLCCCAILSTLACGRGKQEVDSPVALELVADGFVHPLVLTEPPDGTKRLFVVDQIGKIWILAPDGEKLPEPFLDISAQLVELDPAYDERGLLGLAFHPDYASTGRFYVYYTAPLREQAPDNFDHTNVLSEYRVNPNDPNRADPNSERPVLEIDHPYMNHNGATVAFGPDGMLYLGIGDGGNRDDEDQGDVSGHVEDWYEANAGGNGQDIEENLLGSILRIDVEGTPYTVPADNPFHGVPGVLPEIWAYGLRNPYQFSFDPGGSHALITGDVGQESYEEISVITRGGNYGWNVYEGTHCFNAKFPRLPFDSCPTTVGPGHPAAGDPLIPPVIEVQNTVGFPAKGEGLAIVGGVVNRGPSLPSAYQGRYLFGMWSPGKLFAATMSPEGTWPWEPIQLAGTPKGNLDAHLLGFGQDIAGDVFVLTSEAMGPKGQSGKVYRLIAAEPGSQSP